MDYFDIQNEVFFNFLNEMFSISKAKIWDDIAKNITLEKIKKTYKKFAELYPLNFNYLDELKKSRNDFSSIHYSQLKGNKIIDEIVRFSLYSEKIIVFHPLQNPSVTNQSYDPRKKPKYWLPDFMDSLFFYVTLQKWVKSGIVKLIINPYQYNFELRDKIHAAAEKRVKEEDIDEMLLLNTDIGLDNFAEILAPSFKGKSQDFIKRRLLEMQQPYFTEEEALKLSNEIIDAIPKINPLYNKLNIPLDSDMLTTNKGGGPLESILLISEITEASIYTPSEINWHQIKKMGIDDFWIKANHLFSKIELPFLNNVDTNFALELRKENRLAGVRQELKKIYSDLDSIGIKNISESKIRFLQEGFTEAINKAEAEWMGIKKKAETARKQWLTANVAVPFMLNNEISLMPLIAGSAAWLYFNERQTVSEQKDQRKKNPVSVFVDLKNQRQSYFTILKNSLL